MNFPSANTTVTEFLECFQMEVQAVSIAFSECNENITNYALIGVFKMLAGWSVGICQSLKSWRYLVMIHCFMMFLTMLVG
jgi:hypothetical protein